MILDTPVYGNITLWTILAIIIILFAIEIAAKLLTLNLKKALADKVKKSELDALLKGVHVAILFLGFLLIYPLVGGELSGLLVAGGFAGLIIGFASQSVVANLVSGLFLIIERPIKIGEEIGIGDVEGYVEDIHFLSTLVRTYDGIYARIPNEKVFTSPIVNYVTNPARRIEHEVGISYSDDAARAIALIRNVAEHHPFILVSPPPEIFVKTLGDSSVVIKIRYWVPSRVWYETMQESLSLIKKELEAGGIEIPFPQRVIWLKDQRKTTEMERETS
ncbi:MAG: mechanosensitive ion channel family protein [Methanomicrobiales archaeon]|nr:mechanosensitive ion channel family protein [Methanomicrobiales archaeon]